MQRYEYKIEMVPQGNVVDKSAYEAKLNEFGQEGWEVIQTEYAERIGKPYSSILMKRPIVDTQFVLTEDGLTS